MENDQREEARQERDAGIDHPPEQEQPQVYGLEKGLTGWKFSRRGFLSAAAAATAAAATAASTVAKAGESDKAALETDQIQEEWISLEVMADVMTATSPDQAFTQVWTIANKSETTWTKGLSLHFEDNDALQLPDSIQVPDIAPGETVDVQVELASPSEPGIYRHSWHLRAAGNVAPVAHGPLVFQNGCIVESSHPYANDTNRTWNVSNPDTNARSTMVHFSRLEVEEDWDHVHIKESGGTLVQSITGNYPSGLWSEAVRGREVQIQLVSDSMNAGWGFCVDQVRTVDTAHVLYIPILPKQPTPTPTRTPTPSPTPCSCYGVCTCNPHCTCDRIHYWYPN